MTEKSPGKIRLDQLLVDQGLVGTRQIAQSLIMRGDVLIDDVVYDKPGTKISPDKKIRIRGELSRFVGRGGEKIDPLFDRFQIKLDGRVAIDIGSSTGGFTDAMLQRGASLVYAVDVGTNQLAASLRTDSRVEVREQTHAKDLRPEQFDPKPSFVTMDVSFIGIRKILPFVIPVLSPGWEVLLLVKPQFELGPEYVEKGGVVKSEVDRERAVRVVAECLESLGGEVVANAPAALTGAKKGNQEYFLYGREQLLVPTK